MVGVLGRQYRDSSKMVKTRILDEFFAVSGYHRKLAIRFLGKACNHRVQTIPSEVGRSRPVCDETVKEGLIVTWEAADRICSKQLIC